MMALAALLLTVGGFACMALSMQKHYRQVFPAEPSRRGARIRRIAAWLLLGASLVPCVVGEGAAVGVVLWTGILTMSALAVTTLLTYRPRAVAAIAFTAPLCAIVLLVVCHAGRQACQGHAAGEHPRRHVGWRHRGPKAGNAPLRRRLSSREEPTRACVAAVYSFAASCACPR